MKFDWLSTSKHDAFAERTISEFIIKCPPEQFNNTKNRKTNEKINRAIKNLFVEADKFKKEVKLNIYTKARIGNKIMWKLKEAGYEEAFIEEITRDLLIILEKK